LLLLQVEVDRLRREAAAAEAACNTLRDEAKERLDVVCKLQGKLDSLKSKLSATQQRLQESQERL
jgi:predicted  nucleic acid-binding Zn-ribbon protein